MTIDEDTRILVVADWSVEPADVVAECRRRAHRVRAVFILLVPAWLHGADWAGDPRVSMPCARRQLVTLERLCAVADLAVEVAGVGDPDPISAIGDALAAHAVSGVLLCTRVRHMPSHPLDLPHRARRLTGLPVDRVAMRAGRRRAHCLPEEARPLEPARRAVT
jgi:hypothetical protein